MSQAAHIIDAIYRIRSKLQHGGYARDWDRKFAADIVAKYDRFGTNLRLSEKQVAAMYRLAGMAYI